jgi:hypothetical protein
MLQQASQSISNHVSQSGLNLVRKELTGRYFARQFAAGAFMFP